MNNIKIALLNIKKNFKNAKELKSAFITSIIGMCLNNSAFIVLWYYFGKMVGNINGWEPIDILYLYGFSTTSYGIICSLLYGIFNLPTYIATGTFDRYLTTPKNTLMKVSTSAISTSALGDLLFGILCFIIYIYIAKVSMIQILLSLFFMIITSLVFYSFALLCMSISFYLMDGSNISEGLYGLFLSSSLYHGGAFTGILKAIFVFIIPALLLGAIPVEIIKNMDIIKIIGVIILSIIWFIISITFFYKSLKKYESNNFFGFGN